MKKSFLNILLVVTASVLCITRPAAAQSDRFDTGKYMEIQSMILRTLEAQYVDSLELSDLLRTGIDAMLASLDPYTVFVPEENEEDLDMMTTGSYGGVGALIQQLPKGYILISEPYENSAAVRAGLEPGDTIIAIEGESTKELSVADCSSRMRGVPGTQLNMKVIKGRSGDTLDVALTRDRIHVNDVIYYGFLDDSTGYLQLGGFTLNGAKDVRAAVEDMRSTGKMKRMVLDLRGNGGGLMSEAVDILSIFLPEGTMVVSQKGRAIEEEVEYRTSKAPLDTLLPLMVMVNSGSASSSEIVAGAIQDLDRGVIAGTRTYGKGLVQTIRSTGYNTSLKLTVAKYYTPSGRCVQAIDYSHRNADGSVGTVPDSLKKEFTTAGGRKVYDGGGITPDLKIEPKYYSRPVIALLYSNILGEFAIKYYKEHESIAAPGKFALTDEEYDEFVKFAAAREFDARTESYIEMERVLEAFEREELGGEMAGVQAELEAMKDKLSLSKEEFLIANKEVIRQMVADEIVTKYYFNRGGAESAIRQDEQLRKALAEWN